MRQTAAKVWKVAWRVGVCALLLAWIFQAIFYNEGRIAFEETGKSWQALTRFERFEMAWKYGPPAVWLTLKSMQPVALWLSLVLMGANLLVGALRWQLLLRVHGLALPFKRTLEISLVAHFFNSFLLGSVGGDLLKAYYVARETHHKKTEAVITVVVDRILGMFSLLVFAVLMMGPNIALLTSSHRLKSLSLLVMAMGGGCGVFILLSFFGGVSKSIPGARAWLRKIPKGEALERSLEAFREFGRNRQFLWKVVPVALLTNVVIVAHFASLTWGFGLHVPVQSLSVIVPMVTSISALPITPGGLGVRENLYVWMLGAPGIEVPAAQALLLSLIGHAGSVVWSAIGGVVYLTMKRKQHLEEITRDSER